VEDPPSCKIMKMRNIVVFGATGEIGGRIARRCVDVGHKVVGISRGQNKRATVDLSGVEMLQGDHDDENFIRDTVAALDFDAVIDSAPSRNSVELYNRHLGKAKNVFLCSSTGTYVPLQYYPADENHPWREETSVNFHFKSEEDSRALELGAREGFPVTIFRPTNIIGAGREPLELWGGRDIEFFRLLKAGETIAIPPCEKILLQSGSNSDLAEAFVLALNHPDEVVGEIFNISCQRAITLGRYLDAAKDQLKSRSKIRVVSTEELMKTYPQVQWRYGLEFLMEHMCFDISKAKECFGYDPRKTTEEGLHDALAWCEEASLL